MWTILQWRLAPSLEDVDHGGAGAGKSRPLATHSAMIAPPVRRSSSGDHGDKLAIPFAGNASLVHLVEATISPIQLSHAVFIAANPLRR